MKFLGKKNIGGKVLDIGLSDYFVDLAMKANKLLNRQARSENPEVTL